MVSISRKEIERAFLRACRLELRALKPGNVHVHGASPRHGLTVELFEKSAKAAAPAVADPVSSLGQRILEAMRATCAVAGTNTNLGILLMCAPLAQAAIVRDPGEPLRKALRRVLAGATREDTRAIYAAIRLARPGGLGRSARYDVADEPDVPPLAVMAEAAARDRIAWNWVHGLADVFNFGLPLLARLCRQHRDCEEAVSRLALALLARIPDTLIRRRHGAAAAEAVRLRARLLHRRLGNRPYRSVLPLLCAFDRELAEAGLNPGTTADLTVATLFTALLLRPRWARTLEEAAGPC